MLIRKTYILQWFCMFSFFCASHMLYGQDIEQTIKNIQETKFDVSGNVNAQGQYYFSDQLQRGVPLSGTISAFLNFNVLGVGVPFSFNMGTGGRLFNYTLPSYGFVGLSPRYKTLTLHLGDRSMHFDKYSFSGHSFRGVGFEFKPSSWVLSGFYGTLQRAKQEDLQSNHQLEPLYKRVGWGFHGGYQNSKNKLIFSLFNAEDQENSLLNVDSTLNITPGQNTIISVDGKTTLNSIFQISSNVAYSGYTENMNESIGVNSSVAKRFGGLLNTNLSSRWNFAYNAEIKVKTKFGQIFAGYERIDPGFKTFGSLFFQDDLQQVFGGVSAKLFKNVLMINGRLGLKNNNLKGDQANNYNRIIGSLSANYNPSSKLSFVGSYSTFNNVNKKSVVLDPINPLLFTTYILNNQATMLSASYYLIKTKKHQRMIRISGDQTIGKTIINDEVDQNAKLSSYSANAIFGNVNDITKWRYSVFQNNRWSTFGISSIVNHSLGVNVNKQTLNEKFIYGGVFSTTMNTRKSAEEDINAVLFSVGLNATYNIRENMKMGFNGNIISNKVFDDSTKNYNELRCLVFYKVQFK